MTATLSASSRRLSVVIPAYNEEVTIGRVIDHVLRLEMVAEVIVVNDCSKDRTAEIVLQRAATDPRIRLLNHSKNQGKTEALKTAFSQIRGDIVIVQDADLEYDPSEIPDVVEPILNGNADVVYGSRFLVRKASRVLYFYHFLANKMLTFSSNLFTNINLTDVETGYKAFRSEIMRNMVISSRGFGFEIEVTAKIAKLRCAIYEVPISYYGRTYEQGKKIGPMDGVAAFWYILRYNVFTSLSDSYVRIPNLSADSIEKP